MDRLLTVVALLLAVGTLSQGYYVTDARKCNPVGGKWSTILRQCVCFNHYSGPRCDQVTRCLHGQLHNGICLCNYGWHGDLCNQIFCFYGVAVRNDTACKCQEKVAGMYCDSCHIRSSSGPPACLPQDNYKHIELEPLVPEKKGINVVLEIIGNILTDVKALLDKIPYLPLYIIAYMMIRFTLYIDTIVFKQKLHEWKLRIYRVYCKLQDVELKILQAMTFTYRFTTMYHHPTAATTELPHNHWWNRAFHTTRRALFQGKNQWEWPARASGGPHMATAQPAYGSSTPSIHVDIEKVLIYLVNMIFFYLCIRLFFRFMRQMRERRLERESHLATLNAQIDMLEHHVEMLRQVNLNGKCRTCAENEGLPNYEDVVRHQDENTRLLVDEAPVELPATVNQAPQVHQQSANRAEDSDSEDEQHNHGPFLHV